MSEFKQFDRLIDAQDWDKPNGERGRRIITLPGWLIGHYHHSLPGKFENLRCIDEVVRNPLHIYTGVRHLHGGWLGFCGIPEFRYDLPGGRVPMDAGLGYVVYLNARFEIYETSIEILDPKNNNHVVGWNQRYGDVKWTR